TLELTLVQQIEKIVDTLISNNYMGNPDSNKKSEIENQIRLQDEIQNQSDIEQKFREEDDDMKQHGYYKYNYHIKFASHLKTIEEVEYFSEQKNLEKKFEHYVKNFKNENVCESRSNSITVINKIFNTDENYIQEEVEERLEEIKEILTKKKI
ncbi:16760_t:CDS:2, partial [Gigaspora margarita]